MSNDRLISMAKRAAKNPTLIAYLIDKLVTSESSSWKAVSRSQEISIEKLAKLALCKRPRKNYWIADMTEIAEYLALDVNVIATFITEIENLDDLQSSTDDQLLMAARDRDDEEE